MKTSSCVYLRVSLNGCLVRQLDPPSLNALQALIKYKVRRVQVDG